MNNQHKGKITTWNDEKGFGFITPEQGGKNVFFHISQVANKRYRPSKNTFVTYTLGYDDQQRPRAINVQLTSIPTYPAIVASFVSGLFFIILVIFTLTYNKSLLIPVGYVMFSLVTFFAYGRDKSQAMRNGQRVPERSLHILGLLGGWPGGLIGQYHYRHKIKKPSYQVMYWVFVMFNVGVLIWFYSTTSYPNTVIGVSNTSALCEHDPAPIRWTDFPIKIVSIDKSQEFVKLKNITDTTINLDGWIMCSFRGGQQHPIGGEIQPGEIKLFPNPNGNIWNNAEVDNGGLYNKRNEMVSYWKDK